jgi:hypothetical protein
MVNQQNSAPISALSQQLEQVSLDKRHSSSSPKRRPSSKQKSKSDYGTGSGSDLPNNAAAQQIKQKRSPKSNKVNGVKQQQFSTPSKRASVPPSYSPAAAAPSAATAVQDLPAHYAGPTFHSSPAPSSLPMPSFFASKQRPALQNGNDLDSPPNQSTPIKLVRPLSGQEFRDQDDSPLALFFKADREEKNRLRNKHSVDNEVLGSPTHRPASTGGILDHLNLRSESPLLWNGSPHKVNERFDLRSNSNSKFHRLQTDHSTSELSFLMDSEYEHVIPPRNHFVQGFRDTTEPPTEYRLSHSGKNSPANANQHSKQGTHFSLRREPYPTHSDLETSTQTLKNLLSIKSPPSHPSTPPFPAMNGRPSPSPIQHNRTRSAVQSTPRKTSPANATITPSRRVFSTSGVPPNVNQPRAYSQSILPPDQESAVDEDQTIKMEKELRKVLNLS